MRPANINVLLFILLGIIGFGVGGAIGGALWFAFDAPYLGFPMLGACGGASLGLALRDRKRAGLLALGSAVGFGVGYLVGFFIVLAIWEPAHVEGLFIGAVGGGIGGASLGLGLRDWRKTGLLALAGALGFGIVGQVTWNLFRGSDAAVLGLSTKVFIWGVVGGAFLGAMSGYLNRRKTD
ncbi:hypothetical protein ACFLYF_02580 [Chloroflexota bacterium]